MSSTPNLDTRNHNALWAGVFVESLARGGVRTAVISPGSRSAPLAFAFARHPVIESISVLDERSAAFFALGLAKATGKPTVLVCTSGSAAANYYPAIVEARESGVPLLIITADRPAELRACASGQTIDQQKIYGGYVSFFHELTTPELSLPRLRYLRQTAIHALERALLPQPGPVHLNAPFRDPLSPVPDDGATAAFAAKIDWNSFFSHVAPNEAGTHMVATPPTLAPDAHGVIIAGPEQGRDPAAYARTVGELARKLGWPVLADALSPVRHYGEGAPNVVTAYDAILRNRSAAERLKPETVLCLGGWPTSKILRSWLDASDAPTWLMSERMDNRDALHGRTRHSALSLGALVELLPGVTAPNEYEGLWASFERQARQALDGRLQATVELFEGKAAWLLAQHLPPETRLSIANSMPVRDAEYFWPATARRIQPFFNRGANGIDGTLSTAIGVAHRAARPAVLLTGDLALLHDTNGFLLRSSLQGSLTIVLINNRGGGIFEHLPAAEFDPPFEQFFATPQEVDFRSLAATYKVEHVVVRDWAHFTSLVATLPPAGIRLLELQTDRKRDAARRKRWFAEISAALT
ncbi:MAG: hypothetical protein RIQ93_1166 [Verrucomicrobiota bacterium]|jgi:2-succinyl-5-enolpyruvyl-6-hydroxy-3-cyclohexene-1-carboxylate synthase